jgi:hypothetical protein
MHIRLSFFLLAFALACAACAAQQQPEKGHWRAASNTAASITGEISISESKITIYFASFLISPARLLKPAEVSAVFDEAVDTAGNGQLYRVTIPASRRFIKNNTLCGTQDVHWMAVYVAGGSLKLAFFSGDDPPLISFEAMQNSTDLCGIYSYVH